MTDSPGKMAQTIFYLDSKSKLFNSYATKSYASSLVLLSTQKLKNNKKRRSSRFYSFRKTKFEILSNREMEIYHRRNSFPLQIRNDCSLRGNHTLRSEKQTATHVHKRTDKTKESSLFRPCPWNLAKKFETILEYIRSYALSYTAFHLSLLRPSLVKKKKKLVFHP